MIDKVAGCRIGADLDPNVIDALISIRDHVSDLPKSNREFTETDYRELGRSGEYRHKGYAGFAFSYGGKWLGGWRRDKEGRRDYVAESYRNALVQSPRLWGTRLLSVDYRALEVPPTSLIYCDPPYKDTTTYKNPFDHEAFWRWCVDKARGGHTVLISEYDAPDNFECVWQKEIVSSLTKDTGSKRGKERLFIAHR